MPKTKYRFAKNVGLKTTPEIPNIKTNLSTPASERRAWNRDVIKLTKKVRTDVKQFPGLIRGSDTYIDRTPGLFTKSIKGMPGKHYIEKAVTAAIAEYAAEKKHD